jgi:hypothetical protein
VHFLHPGARTVVFSNDAWSQGDTYEPPPPDDSLDKILEGLRTSTSPDVNVSD